jgi:hypothetical protein
VLVTESTMRRLLVTFNFNSKQMAVSMIFLEFILEKKTVSRWQDKTTLISKISNSFARGRTFASCPRATIDCPRTIDCCWRTTSNYSRKIAPCPRTTFVRLKYLSVVRCPTKQQKPKNRLFVAVQVGEKPLVPLLFFFNIPNLIA